MKKIEHLSEANTVKFFTDEMKKNGKITTMKQCFNNVIEDTHFAGDIPDKINELVDAVNMLYDYIEYGK